MSEKTKKRHWPAIIIVAACALVFIISSMTYTVSNSEHVIVTRFGALKEDGVAKAGLNFKFPYPIDNIIRIDSRLQHFERPLTQTALKDVKNILVSISAGWRVSDPAVFLKTVNSIKSAETVMKNVVGTPTGNVFPKYSMDEIFTTNSKQHKLDEIRGKILAGAKTFAAKYGIEVTYIGFSQIAFAPSATKSVMDRMKSDRKVIAETIRNKGKEEAQEIIRKAKQEAQSKEATASIKAETIRRKGEIDAQAIFKEFENPELVAFLRQLESLEKLLNDRTQMVIDLNTPPFNLLKGDFFEELKKKSKNNK